MSAMLFAAEPLDEFDEMYEKSIATTPQVTFVDTDLADSFDCAICYDKLRNAVAVCDDHLFCEECINELMDKLGPIFNCPTCRRKCNQHEIKRVRFVDRQIKALLIKCPNHEITATKAIYLKKAAKKSKKPKKKVRNNSRKRARSPSPSRSRSRSRSRDRNRATSNENEEKDMEKSEKSEKNEKSDTDVSVLEFCDWTGKLERLAYHIQKCPHEIIRCAECDECIERGKMDIHSSKECEMYPVQCKLCNNLVPRNYMQYHKEKVCVMAQINCGSCNKEIQRMDMKKHYNKCPQAIVDCHYYKYGCKEMCMKRKDLNKHLKDNINQHLRLVCESHANLEEKVNEINQETQQRFLNLEQMLYSGNLYGWRP